MKQRTVRVLAGTFAAVLCLAGCGAPPIPQEKVPEGWTLDVHQPGEWWMRPLIPRSSSLEPCATAWLPRSYGCKILPVKYLKAS